MAPILIVPGLGGSGGSHWQTHLEERRFEPGPTRASGRLGSTRSCCLDGTARRSARSRAGARCWWRTAWAARLHRPRRVRPRRPPHRRRAAGGTGRRRLRANVRVARRFRTDAAPPVCVPIRGSRQPRRSLHAVRASARPRARLECGLSGCGCNRSHQHCGRIRPLADRRSAGRQPLPADRAARPCQIWNMSATLLPSPIASMSASVNRSSTSAMASRTRPMVRRITQLRTSPQSRHGW